MKYLSVCSGIEAATVAWHPLGWEPWAFSEIEKFPAAVLAHHYPDTPNLGDMTRFGEWPDATIDVLVGGTPCQSFSVAGLRAGLDDPRGNLMLTYLAIAGRYRPKWLVWENVPGVLSSSGGRDFGTFLRGLGECGYGWAYRVLDAQYFGVPQRRRRVFVVGHLGDWRRAAAVLFERHSLQGHPAPRREAGQRVAPAIGCGPPFSRTGNDRVELDAIVASTGDISHCLSHALRGEGFDASEDGTGRGTPLVPVSVFDPNQVTSKTNRSVPTPELCHTLPETPNAPVAFDLRGRDGGAMPEGPHDTANIRAASGGSSRSYIAHPAAVRRLTPVECERLQGFPDHHTAIPWRNKPAENCPDGPRYKALGNSMAVPVMRWIGERIQMVEAIE